MQVCRNWYSCFYLPRVWSTFLVDDHTLTRQRYNYYSGWQHTLDHLRTQYCLHRVGRHIKGLDFRPQHSFNNLFQFMTLVSWCIEQVSCVPKTEQTRTPGIFPKPWSIISSALQSPRFTCKCIHPSVPFNCFPLNMCPTPEPETEPQCRGGGNRSADN